MENLFWIGLVGAALALLFAVYQSRKVMQYSEGTDAMKKIAAAIRKGANAYLKRQYKTVAIIFLIISVVLAILAFFFKMLSPFVPFAFLTGGIYSCLAGFIGKEDCHELQRPDGERREREPQPRPARGHFLRLRHGLHRGRARHSRRHTLVPHP